MHVLPTGFVRVNHFDLLDNRHRTEKLKWCREQLAIAQTRKANPTRVRLFQSRRRARNRR
jgi:hypothetical protein